jgi:hypothetical protein
MATGIGSARVWPKGAIFSHHEDRRMANRDEGGIVRGRAGRGSPGRLGRWCRPVAEILEGRQLLATVTVTSVGDSNHFDDPDTLSLRQAIEIVDGTLPISSLTPQEQALVSGPLSTPNTIAFNIPDFSPIPALNIPFTFDPDSLLPAITTPVIIDGYSQPGSHPNTNGPGLPDNAVILIEISGSNISPTADNHFNQGLEIDGGDSTVQGLAIDGFQTLNPGSNEGAPGLKIALNGNDAIRGNFIGTDVTGTVAHPNGTGISFNLQGSTRNVTIGGTTPGDRNLISGNNRGIDNRFGNANLLVQGDFIGTDRSGTRALSNQQGAIFAANTDTVGGTAAGAGNVISGNGGPGVSNAGLVQGNLIGTDLTGTRPLGNAIGVSASVGAVIGGPTASARNVISGNGTGISVQQYPYHLTPTIPPDQFPDLVIQGNFIGTDATGTLPIGNDTGVDLFLTAGVLVAGNVISGNRLDGLDTLDVPDAGLPAREDRAGQHIPQMFYVSGNLVEGNFIGTDTTGLSLLPNGGFGIDLAGDNSTIGGTAAGAGNVIAGNRLDGLFLASHVQLRDPNSPLQTPSIHNLVEGNFIGTDPTGIRPLGNSGAGVRVQGSSNTIGGTAAGAANVIAYNLNTGVTVVADASSFPGVVVAGSGQSDTISGNSIFANGGLGIDLGLDGVTPNSPAGSPTGPNRLQPYPVLISAAPGGLGTLISGALDALPSTSYAVEFFSSPVADPSGFGQGRKFLGSTLVTTDAVGHASIAFSTAAPLAGQAISTTATGPQGDTSEFARDLPAGPLATAMTLIESSSVAITGQPATFAAVVVAAGGTPTGLVAFEQDGLPIGLAPLDASGVAVFVTDRLPPGPHAITAAYLGDPAHAAGTSNALAVGVFAPLAFGGPAVTSVAAGPGSVTIRFNRGLLSGPARDPRNYAIAGPGHHALAVASAAYDPGTDSVTLTTSQRLVAGRTYQLTINGRRGARVVDVFGIPLDGQKKGKPGHDFVGRFSVRKAAVARGSHPAGPRNLSIDRRTGG